MKYAQNFLMENKRNNIREQQLLLFITEKLMVNFLLFYMKMIHFGSRHNEFS